MAGRPLTTSAEAFLEGLNFSEPPTFPVLLEQLYQQRYQGTLIFHFAGGIPRKVEFPCPVQLPLAALDQKTA